MQTQTLFAIILLILTGTGMFSTPTQSEPEKDDSFFFLPSDNPFQKERKNRFMQAQMTAASQLSKVHYDQARDLMKQGKLNEAEQEALEGLRIMQPLPHATAYVLLGEIYLKGGQKQKALQSFETASRHTRNTRLGLNIALLYCQMGDYEHARQSNPDLSFLGYAVGGQSLDSADMLGTDTLNDLHAGILLSLGRDATLKSDYKEAAAYFQAASRYAPNNPLIHYFWAESLFSETTLGHRDRIADAIAHYEAAAKHGHGVLLSYIQDRLYHAHARLDNARALKAEQAKQDAAQAQAKTGP